MRVSLSCSLAVHTAPLLLLLLTDGAAVQPVSLAGRRDAVSIQSAWAPPTPEIPTEVDRAEEEPRRESHDVPPTEFEVADVVEVELEPAATAERVTLPEAAIATEPVSTLSDSMPQQVSSVQPPPRTAPVDPATVKMAQQIRTSQPILKPPVAQVMMAAAQQQAGTNNQEPPNFQGNQPPAYPADAIVRGLEGTVVLRLTIDASGRVADVEVVDSSGHAELDEAAVEAVRKWRGQPAQRNGRPVASRQLLPIRFRL